MEGVTIFDWAWNLSMAEEPVLRARAFNNSGRSVSSAVQLSITDHHCLARLDRLREVEAIVVNRYMLDSLVGRPWEGLKAGVQGQMGFRRHSNRGRSHRCDNQLNTRNCQALVALVHLVRMLSTHLATLACMTSTWSSMEQSGQLIVPRASQALCTSNHWMV